MERAHKGHNEGIFNCLFYGYTNAKKCIQNTLEYSALGINTNYFVPLLESKNPIKFNHIKICIVTHVI